MAKRLRKCIALAQNCFCCAERVHALVAASTIDSTDTIIEIGPGEGMITQELAKVARQVVAVEKDPTLVADLRHRFGAFPNVAIIQGDFLTTPLGITDYKLFANIPFCCTAPIMRTILYGGNPPHAAYLVLQKEAAQKFAGWPRETQASILAKPWFEFQIVWALQRTDFVPVPGVDVVFLQIKQRDPPLIGTMQAPLYRQFVRYGFGSRRQSLRVTYQPIFTYRQWQRFAHDLRFAREATPTQLTFAQWLGLFAGFQAHVACARQAIVRIS